MKKPKNAVEIPPYFRCPISFDLMEDPVILSSGITYERSSILQWLRDGNKICPVTRQPLDESCELIPNSTLGQLIRSWSATNIPSDQVIVEEVLRKIGTERRAIVLERSFLQGLREFSVEHSIWAKAAGCEELVLALVLLVLPRDRAEAQEKEADRAAGLSILRRLCHIDARLASRVSFSCLDSLHEFADLLASSSKSVREDCVNLLEILLRAAPDRERRQVADHHAHDSLAQALLWQLAKNKGDPDEGTNHVAIRCLLLLVAAEGFRSKLRALIRGGAPALLVDLLASQSSPALKQHCLELLKALCACAEGREALALDHARAVPAVLACALKISLPATELATFIVWAIVFRARSVSPALEDSIVDAGGLSTMVMVLQCDCSVATKHRAGDVLKHFSWLWKLQSL